MAGRHSSRRRRTYVRRGKSSGRRTGGIHLRAADAALRRRVSLRWLLDRGAPRLRPDGSFAGFIGSCIDITDHRLAEEALESARDELEVRVARRTEQLEKANQVLQAIVEGTAAEVGEDFFRSLVHHLALALDVRYALVSERVSGTENRVRVLQMWTGEGLTQDISLDLSGAPCDRVLGGERVAIFDGVQQEFPRHSLLRDLKAEGYAAAPLVDSSGDIIGHLAIIDTKPLDRAGRAGAILEIFAARAAAELERKKAEQARRKAETDLHQVASSVSDALWSADVEPGGATHRFYSSPVIEKLTGLPPEYFMGNLSRWTDIVHPEDRGGIESATERLVDGRVDHEEEVYRIIRVDGEIRWVRDSVTALNVEGGLRRLNGVVSDITPRKHLEAQLLQAQKLEAIGLPAGGVAHDFNNILENMTLFTELARSELTGDSKAARHLDRSLEAGKRAGELVKQILAFSPQSDQVRRPIDLGAVVAEALQLVRASLPSAVELRSEIDPAGGNVLADQTQIHQVVMNLCGNASQAMQSQGGVIEVTVSALEVNATLASRRLNLSEGAYVKLVVRDSGPGIAPRNRDRIFEPFFTTKGVGEGTGLGLSVVHGIVNAHGGAILVDSELRKGTTFSVYFPKASARPEPEPQVQGEPSGNGHILFVDDDETLVEAARLILEKVGYRVTSYTNSRQAPREFQVNAEIFDAAILDVTMPGISGVELATRMIQLRPNFPVTLCTGYSNLLTPAELKRIGVSELAMKPLGSKDLAANARRAVERGRE